MLSMRGLTMSKVEHVRQALHQICADEHDARTQTARIMAEHDVRTRDVMDVCDVAMDVVVARRESSMTPAMPMPSVTVPYAPTRQGVTDEQARAYRESIEANRARALGDAK